MKNLISTLLCLTILVVFTSCSTSSTLTIDENSVVMRTEISNKIEAGRYWVVTEDYNFFTNEKYMVGDTVKLTK